MRARLSNGSAHQRTDEMLVQLTLSKKQNQNKSIPQCRKCLLLLTRFDSGLCLSVGAGWEVKRAAGIRLNCCALMRQPQLFCTRNVRHKRPGESIQAALSYSIQRALSRAPQSNISALLCWDELLFPRRKSISKCFPRR